TAVTIIAVSALIMLFAALFPQQQAFAANFVVSDAESCAALPSGSPEWNAGTCEIDGTLTVATGDTFTIFGVALKILDGGTIDNDGTIESFGIITNEGTIDNDGSFLNLGPITNEGTINNQGY